MQDARVSAFLTAIARLVLSVALALFLTGPGQAAWRAVEGIDVASGKSSLLMIGDLDEQTGLYARCIDGHAELFLDGFDGGDFEIAPVGPVNLIIATDTGKTWTSEARYAREKPGYITTTWLTRETISAVVAELAAAKSAISITIEFSDTGDISVWDTDAKGSTAAGRAFLAACPQTSFSGLPAPQLVPPPQPAPQPEPAVEPEPEIDLPLANWTLDSDGPVLRISGQLDNEHVLTFNCTADGAVVLISKDGSDTPVPARTLDLSMSADNREPLRVPARMVRIAPGYLAFSQIAQDVSHVAFMRDLIEARERIDVWLDDPESGLGLNWTVSPVGLPNVALEYFALCVSSAPIDDLRPEGAPAPAPSGWAFDKFTDGGTMLSTRNTAHDGRFLLQCKKDRALSLGYQIDVFASLQLTGDIAPARIRVGRETYMAAFGVASITNGGAFLTSLDANTAQSIARALVSGPQVTVTFPVGATGELYERQFDTNNLAEAAQQFVASCLGG